MAGVIPSMNQEEYLLLNELITRRFGITFPEARRQLLESRLRPRLQDLHLQSFRDYYIHLQCDTNGEGHRLAESVTNNETYFFRESRQLETLFTEPQSLVCPSGSMRVLSVGCSSGEEPYSLAILARKHLQLLSGVRPDIHAVDLDASRIEMARQAEYGRTSLRALSETEIACHFVPQGAERWALKPCYRSAVRFAWGNLLDLRTLPSVETGFDAVFCRNVLIYFADNALQRAVCNFARLLRPGGLLFLGASESIIGLSKDFETLRFGGGIAYRYCP